jgi:hypothetical protein
MCGNKDSRRELKSRGGWSRFVLISGSGHDVSLP